VRWDVFPGLAAFPEERASGQGLGGAERRLAGWRPSGSENRRGVRINSPAVASAELIVGVSGGSGAWLARRFVERIQTAGLGRLHLVFSAAAIEVARNEISAGIAGPEDWLRHLALPRAATRRITVHPNDDVGAATLRLLSRPQTSAALARSAPSPTASRGTSCRGRPTCS
jgi:hypothetical protein